MFMATSQVRKQNDILTTDQMTGIEHLLDILNMLMFFQKR